MKINQIYTLINSVSKEMWGSEAIQANDLTGLISLGNTVLSTTNNTDVFLNKLIDRIGRTVIRTLDVEIEDPYILRNEFEFGAILQKINIQPLDAAENSDYNIGNAEFEPTFAQIDKAEVSQTFFEGSDTWAYRITIPYDLFSTAFTGAEAMGAFITGIIDSMEKSLVMSINNMNRTAVNNLVLEKVKSESTGIINLVSAYNAYTSENIAVGTTALTNTEFLKYAGKMLRQYIKYLAEPSTLFNDSGVVRATQRDNLLVILNTDFVGSYTTYLQADTFNAEMTELPMFIETPTWQAAQSRLEIKGTPSSGTTADPYDITNVIGVYADRQAIATGINKRRSGTFTNDIDGYTNYKQSANIQYINDLSENALVFTLN